MHHQKMQYILHTHAHKYVDLWPTYVYTTRSNAPIAGHSIDLAPYLCSVGGIGALPSLALYFQMFYCLVASNTLTCSSNFSAASTGIHNPRG